MNAVFMKAECAGEEIFDGFKIPVLVPIFA